MAPIPAVDTRPVVTDRSGMSAPSQPDLQRLYEALDAGIPPLALHTVAQAKVLEWLNLLIIFGEVPKYYHWSVCAFQL